MKILLSITNIHNTNLLEMQNIELQMSHSGLGIFSQGLQTISVYINV